MDGTLQQACMYSNLCLKKSINEKDNRTQGTFT